MHGSDDVRDDLEAAVPAKLQLTASSYPMGHHDAVHLCCLRVGYVEREWLCPIPVEEEPIRQRSNPSFCPPHFFFRRVFNRPAVPTVPVQLRVAGIREG